MLDQNFKTFVVHMAILKAQLLKMTIHLLQKAQIATVKQNKASTQVSTKYSKFANVFSEKKALMLPQQINLNKHAIKLEDDKQSFYKPIYSLGPVELKTLKAGIKIYLKTGFIWPSKFLAGASILFDKKPNGNFWLDINYQGLNNLTIKN